MSTFLDWFLEPFKVFGLNPQTISLILNPIWQIIKNWWWLPFLFVLWSQFKYHWYWWRVDLADAKIKKVLLEIKLPAEVPKPIKAMEQIFSGLHAIHDPPTNWREKWIEGKFQLGFSLEIVSLGGEVHFYIRTPKEFQNLIESNIYAQYPEAEIFEAEDYTKKVPQDIPNKDWDLWGTSIINTKEDPYPIKTYTQFESESLNKEEKRIDPLSGLLENLASLKEGEQMWVQINAKPIRDEKPWVKRGLEIRDKLVKRPAKPIPKPMFQEAAEILISGPPSPKSEEKETIPPEMKLTPGEREIVSAIESKISKHGFDCNIRYIYLGRKDVFFKPRVRIPFAFFKEVSTENLGGFKPEKRVITKVKTVFLWFLDERRLYLRKRKIFRNYQMRVPPFFPQLGGTFVLNTEELATLYHFPGRIVAPSASIPRVEAKKLEPPPGLPII